MSPHYATHAGMLKYVAREFNELARTDRKHTKRLKLYAAILERMINEIATGSEAA